MAEWWKLPAQVRRAIASLSGILMRGLWKRLDRDRNCSVLMASSIESEVIGPYFQEDMAFPFQAASLKDVTKFLWNSYREKEAALVILLFLPGSARLPLPRQYPCRPPCQLGDKCDRRNHPQQRRPVLMLSSYNTYLILPLDIPASQDRKSTRLN